MCCSQFSKREAPDTHQRDPNRDESREPLGRVGTEEGRGRDLRDGPQEPLCYGEDEDGGSPGEEGYFLSL